jgi:hypothetical protein
MTQEQRILEELANTDLELVRNPLGRHHRASDWLEDGDDTLYYLATDGDLYAETDEGRECVGALSRDALAKLK